MAEGRGERTIGSGHLVALFLGIVVLCCVFFILGYEMARAQFGKGGTTVAVKPGASAPATAPSTEAPSTGWPTSVNNTSAPEKAAASPSSPPKTSPAAKPAAASSGGAQSAANALLKPPDIPKGSIVLQVAANKNENDALNLARLLQEKGFPAFVLTPSTDDWYRVQVGPFPDAKAAEQAKAALAQEGFKAIAKR